MNTNTSNQVLNHRYQIIRELSRQTGRRTLLALDLETQRQVVVKILYLGQDFDWQDLKLFERESIILKNLHHPQIPNYLDYFEFDATNDKGFGLVQTYIEAQSLEAQLQAGRRFSEDEVKELAKSLLVILDYLHEQEPPIIHRDIKPSNILLTNRSGNSVGEVYLVDFGSVQNIAAQEGGTITVVGTYGYMPPEQFGGRTKPASDLYSLGATLIYIMTGLHPTELPQQDLHIQFCQAIDASQEFASWLEWMVEPSLEKRFTSAKIALAAIENPPARTNLVKDSNQPLNKPLETKIRLIKTPEKLEIILPPTGFGIGLITLISCLTPIAIGSPFFSQMLAQTHAFIAFIVWLLQISAIAFVGFLILSAIDKRTRLQLQSNQMNIVNEIFGFTWQSYETITIYDIAQITVVYDTYETRLKENLFIFNQNKLVFDFDTYSNLTTLEREWLAAEISNWLKLQMS
ncbi:serine/threonine-protein kinase [Calothrix sp. UHCC 0171]|uniref:serine/threonine protein kinase n=1 Tax=Calothrix sp. UHCC 0171 TaxID=3110245 RepID=UPI002B2019CE|nr:serine/threonine-protein kinase [Calothrix sp. UHCC 0171]MEA5572741.1 serine/threonine-protein kinase [Calothrix sp. UHCC 0171]